MYQSLRLKNNIQSDHARRRQQNEGKQTWNGIELKKNPDGKKRIRENRKREEG